MLEVLAATVVLAVGLGATFQLLNSSLRTTSTDRFRQAETSVARELTEDTRSLAYTGLTSTAIASALESMVSNSTASGSTLTVSRLLSGTANQDFPFTATFTSCSMDDPADGTGDHSQPPASGGSWCADVGSNGTADSQPDDYRRVSVTVAPAGGRTTPTVQQTVLIYNRATHGPAVTCLSLTATCPGANQTYSTGTQLTFNVTTTTPAASVQWLVNGSAPASTQLTTGENDPYTPSSTTSTFTWVFPNTDGTYTISAQAFDSNGNSGTKSQLQISLNLHQAMPPTSVTAGYNQQIGGVDIQWVPSVDQDVQSYDVYEKSGSTTTEVCTAVTGLSCNYLSAPSPLPEPASCSTSSTSFTTADNYWVLGVDTNPATGNPRESTNKSPVVDADLCDHPPSAPTGLTGTLSGGQITLSWTAPTDPDSWDLVQFWRVYRWAGTGTNNYPGDRYDLIGTLDSSGNQVTSYTDSSPDPGGVNQNYCVTAVDTHLDESPCSNAVSG
jgi:hypothetical protein